MTIKRSLPMFWLLFLVCAGSLLLALLATGIVAFHLLSESYSERVAAQLEAQARQFAERVLPDLESGTYDPIQALARQLGQDTSARITLILPDGTVIADTDADPATMDDHSYREEILQAAQEGVGRSTRFSATRKKYFLYVAVLMTEGTQRLAYARVAMPLTGIEDNLGIIGNQMIFSLVITGGLLLVAIAFLSRRLTHPLEEMRQGALRIGQGDLTHRIYTHGSSEINALAESINEMAGNLESFVETISRQNQESSAILRGMADGVIAFDAEFHILQVNNAAASMLQQSPDVLKGSILHESIRVPGLLELAEQSLQSPTTLRREVELPAEPNLQIRLQAAQIRHPDQTLIGGLLLLHDMTQQKQDEEARRAFVENASHELRTPTTAIRGFCETLLDGASNDPGATERFLTLTHKNARRLEAIIDDLLSLARMDRYANEGLALESGRILDILKAAREECLPLAEREEIEIHIDCDEQLQAQIYPPLLIQALRNLIENAIVYSKSKDAIYIQAHHGGSMVEIAVHDRGCGIASKHLPHLFERFYRADPSRSRDYGGTGLGLAIVQHIMRAHNGHVLVKSTLGQGSTFTLFLQEASAE